MSKTRYCCSTRVTDFCKDPHYVDLLHAHGIYTIGGFLQTPIRVFISNKDLLDNYEKYKIMFFRIHKLVCFQNFTL